MPYSASDRSARRCRLHACLFLQGQYRPNYPTRPRLITLQDARYSDSEEMLEKKMPDPEKSPIGYFDLNPSPGPRQPARSLWIPAKANRVSIYPWTDRNTVKVSTTPALLRTGTNASKLTRARDKQVPVIPSPKRSASLFPDRLTRHSKTPRFHDDATYVLPPLPFVGSTQSERKRSGSVSSSSSKASSFEDIPPPVYSPSNPLPPVPAASRRGMGLPSNPKPRALAG